jgi:tRNA 2-thiouridine synthesizing protein A
MEQTTATVIDCVGLSCPVPVINLAKRITEVPVGGVVVLLADDPGAKVDIPVWCRMKGHELVDAGVADTGWRFRVRRTH